MRYKDQFIFFPYIIILFEIATYLSNDMYLPSMPAIGRDLGLTHDQTQATLTWWFLGASSLQLFIGPISDAYGRKHVLSIGALLFVISSALCAWTSDYTLMILARFIQGTVVGFVVVAGNAAIHESFDSKTAIKFLAIMGAITILAPAFGPMVGALLVQYSSWRVIFWFLAGLGLLSVVCLLLFMPETNNSQHKINFRKVIADYKEIISNSRFMMLSFCYSLLVTIFFFWMFESPFIMIELHNSTPLFYGIAQTIIFSGFFVGARFIDKTLEKFELNSVLRFFMLITIISSLFLTLFSYLYDSINMAIVCMTIISIATSMMFGPINRVAIESSSVPMGRRTALFSVFIGLLGAATGWILTMVKQQNLYSMSVMITASSILTALVLFSMRLRSDIQPEKITSGK